MVSPGSGLQFRPWAPPPDAHAEAAPMAATVASSIVACSVFLILSFLLIVMRSTTVAVVQAEIASDLESGLRLTAELTAQAASRGARLVVFPETWLPGYPVWLDVCRDVALWDHAPVKRVFARMADESVVVGGESGNALAGIARRNGVTLVVGVTERVAAGVGRGTLYNSLLIY